MATRGSWGFRYKEKDYLFLCLYEAFPASLLSDLLDSFLSLNLNSEIMKKHTKELEILNENNFKESLEKLKLIFKNQPRKYIYEDISKLKNIKELQIFLTQNLDILTLIFEHNVTTFDFNNDFIKNGLFCEYAYIFNLDEEVLEIYQGSPEIAGTGRYIHNDSNNIGCHLKAVINLKRLEKINKNEFSILCSSDLNFHTYNQRRKDAIIKNDENILDRLVILNNIITQK